MAKRYNLKRLIINHLRQISRFYPPKYEALRASVIDATKKKLDREYRCAKCEGAFVEALVQVDHINPVVDPNTVQTEMDWNLYIKNLFCSVENFQVLCRQCHYQKTQAEKDQRVLVKKKEKQSRQTRGDA